MAFTPDLPAAARRHLQAAIALDGEIRRDVAGYLYGIAAECAIKSMMLDFGLRPTSEPNDPFFAHFPILLTLVGEKTKGRRGGPLVIYTNQANFMQNWSIKMRYCSGKEIDKRWIDIWSKQARQVVSAMGT